MDFLMISQVFWPDTASTAQHLFDLAEELVEEGHAVTVYCSRYAYENNQIKYPLKENYGQIKIIRINNTGFGKKRWLGRIFDFASFNLLLFFKLLRVRRKEFNAVIGMTSPPLVSLLGVVVSKWKRIHFFYWVMDLQPELAIASGLIKKNSPLAKIFEWMGNYIIRNANLIIVLDKYMRDYVVRRGGRPKIIHVIPVWPVMEKTYEGERLQNPFRQEHGFGERIVIMYSGNHSYVHPLDTLLEAIVRLKNEAEFLFVFIGDGVRKQDVTNFVKKHQLENVRQLPYQPRNNIHNSLGASDVQVVIMGESQIGFTHPNKIYGAMFMGKPVLYIGPEPSHITDILNEISGNILVGNRQTDELVKKLLTFKANGLEKMSHTGLQNQNKARKEFGPKKLKMDLVDVLTSVE